MWRNQWEEMCAYDGYYAYIDYERWMAKMKAEEEELMWISLSCSEQ